MVYSILYLFETLAPILLEAVNARWVPQEARIPQQEEGRPEADATFHFAASAAKSAQPSSSNREELSLEAQQIQREARAYQALNAWFSDQETGLSFASSTDMF